MEIKQESQQTDCMYTVENSFPALGLLEQCPTVGKKS